MGATSGAKPHTSDVALDNDLVELRKRIAGLESKICQDNLGNNNNSTGIPTHPENAPSVRYNNINESEMRPGMMSSSR